MNKTQFEHKCFEIIYRRLLIIQYTYNTKHTNFEISFQFEAEKNEKKNRIK